MVLGMAGMVVGVDANGVGVDGVGGGTGDGFGEMLHGMLHRAPNPLACGVDGVVEGLR